jgi:hypothetical protein
VRLTKNFRVEIDDEELAAGLPTAVPMKSVFTFIGSLNLILSWEIMIIWWITLFLWCVRSLALTEDLILAAALFAWWHDVHSSTAFELALCLELTHKFRNWRELFLFSHRHTIMRE